jgi:hypothetical protein
VRVPGLARSFAKTAVLALVAACSACHTGSSFSYTPPIFVTIQRNGQPVAGTVAAVAPDGSIAARLHISAALSEKGFPLNLPGNKTYVIRGTTDEGASCGPVTRTIVIEHRRTIGPGPLTADLECRS